MTPEKFIGKSSAPAREQHPAARAHLRRRGKRLQPPKPTDAGLKGVWRCFATRATQTMDGEALAP
jgi:hypothetical protein